MTVIVSLFLPCYSAVLTCRPTSVYFYYELYSKMLIRWLYKNLFLRGSANVIGYWWWWWWWCCLQYRQVFDAQSVTAAKATRTVSVIRRRLKTVTVMTTASPSPSTQAAVTYQRWLLSQSQYDFPLVINSNLGPISNCLATVHLWNTDDGRQSCYRRLQHICSASKISL